MMKYARILSLLTALLLVFTCAAVAEEEALPNSLTISNFADDTGAYTMQVEWYNSGELYIVIEQSVSDTQCYVWSIEAENAFESPFDYNEATCSNVTLDPAEDAIVDGELLYTDGTGIIAIDGEVITWTDHVGGTQIVFGLVDSKTVVYYNETTGSGAIMTVISTDEINSVLQVAISAEFGDHTTGWELVLIWNDAQNAYVYENGVCTNFYAESEETVYTNGTGTFALMADGSLGWTACSGNTGAGWTFAVEMLE